MDALRRVWDWREDLALRRHGRDDRFVVAYRLQDGRQKVLHEGKVAGVMEKRGEEAHNARLLRKDKAGRKVALRRL